MPEVVAQPTKAPREPKNGVNTPALMATINAVRETPALAKFQFRASNRWLNGTYSESRVESFSARAASTSDASSAQRRYTACSSAGIVVRLVTPPAAWPPASRLVSATSPRPRGVT
jgi:hypothetical protein